MSDHTEPAAAAAAGGTTARMYASVADAIHPPVAPRSRFVAGGLRADTLTAAAAPIGPAPRTALSESARARLRSASAAPPPVAPSNVGFRLLTKAGWREGTGLGAKAQGPLEPVVAFQKANRAGVGGESAASLQLVGAPERPPPPPRPKPAPQRAAAEAGAAGGPPKTDKELSQEQLAAYVRKRARDAAIQRGMYREFADTGAEGSGGDANPLTRRRTGGDRLRDTNPLRGMF